MQTARPHLAVINGHAIPAPTTAQQRAARFVSARIKDADASQWHGGYIHGLIQALTMAGAITIKQGSKLEVEQEKASCAAMSRNAIAAVPRRAVGGVA
ncbi:MAG: hypothetical protein PHI29_09120 [Gallionella sp.]|nr:hypothetical protein [Gallionella sp.]